MPLFLLGLLFCVVFSLAGCTTLKPVDLPSEYTPPPADAPLWDAIAANAPADWHVLLNEGPAALDWRLRAIDSATESIDMQTFLWKFDIAGAMVLKHLVDAADRGITIKILIDDTFLVSEDEMLLALAQHPNIEYRVFNPFKRRHGGMATRQLLNLAEFHRLDHRMHNKSMIVDDRVGIVGGRNIADEYFGLSDQANFRDLELLIGGAIVQQIATAFDDYWNDPWSFPIDLISHGKASPEQLLEAQRIHASNTDLHEEESLEQLTGSWLSLVAGADTGIATLYVDVPPDENPKYRDEAPVQVANELVEIFDAAGEEIIIVSAYLIPTPDLEGAVTRAIARGVRIRILTNSLRSNNHVTAHSAYRKHIDGLLESGAEVHEVRIDAKDRDLYMVSPVDRKALALHAKALVIDRDKVFIGSANLDPRSLRINTEMGFLVESESFNSQLREAIEGDFSGANAWRLEMQPDGKIFWVADDQTLESQPAMSFMQRLEDWFFAHLPLESEL